MKNKLLRALKIKLYYHLIRHKKDVLCKGKIIVKDWPVIDIRDGGALELGNRVTLNSENKHYHVNLYAPTKLFARNAGAKIFIGENTRVHGSCIHATKSIRIGNNCLIAGNCQIFDCSGHDVYAIHGERPVTTDAKPILIEDNVWIGINSIILPGTVLGKGTVVAAGSVVRGEFGPYSLIGGNPAVLIKALDRGEGEVERRKVMLG